jgi:16S rRNA (cytosine1402-N4)-methyltransferase
MRARAEAARPPVSREPTAAKATMRANGATLVHMPAEHEPVLASELTDLLAPQPGQTAVDCTFGAGGHARRIAAAIGSTGTLVCIDRDPAAEARFERFAAEARCRARFLGEDYAAGLRTLRGEGIHPDMVYMDLGMSSMQVDARERGFSYSYDAPLDMRMDTRQELSAADLLNEWPESRIAQMLRRFGEERYAGGIAREIVRRRPLRSTSELVAAVKAGIPPSARFGGGHPAKRTFQAVRIAVNGELDALDDALPTAWQILPVGGRLAAISFHSLEDRRVKRFLVERARGCVCPPELPVCACGREPEAELLTRRAVAPQPEEVAANPRSKSAHLRAAVKIAERAPAGGEA